MFTVNVEKIVKMTETESSCFNQAVKAMTDNITYDMVSLGIVGDGITAFKLAYKYAEENHRVLFVDADTDADNFLGKYKIGKEMKGFNECTNSDSVGRDADVCHTNKDNVNIIFCGKNNKYLTANQIEQGVKQIVNEYKFVYNLIIFLSDSDGMVASFCDSTIIISNHEQLENDEIKLKIKDLKEKGCSVMGVIESE